MQGFLFLFLQHHAPTYCCKSSLPHSHVGPGPSPGALPRGVTDLSMSLTRNVESQGARPTYGASCQAEYQRINRLKVELTYIIHEVFLRETTAAAAVLYSSTGAIQHYAPGRYTALALLCQVPSIWHFCIVVFHVPGIRLCVRTRTIDTIFTVSNHYRVRVRRAYCSSLHV